MPSGVAATPAIKPFMGAMPEGESDVHVTVVGSRL
jgi:hypothetical protein